MKKALALSFTLIALASPVWGQDTPTVTNTPVNTPTRTPTNTPANTATITPTRTPTLAIHNSTEFDAYEFFQVTVDPASCNATTSCVWSAGALGAHPYDPVFVFRPASLNDDLLIQGARITINNQIDILIYNPTGGGIDQGATTFYGYWVDRTQLGQPQAVYTFKPTPTP